MAFFIMRTFTANIFLASVIVLSGCASLEQQPPSEITAAENQAISVESEIQTAISNRDTSIALANSVPTQTPPEIASHSQISHDDFRKITRIDGEALGNIIYNQYRLVAWKSDNDTNTLYEVRFETMREGWAFWSEAFDDSGKQLPVVKVSTDVGDDGATYEVITVPLTYDYLDEHKAGMKMRIDGQRAQQVIVLPANYIEGFFLKVRSAGL